ncbi:TetR/AcrR family transcriptional regulator [Pseudonocardia sp. TRM90224]|uniref:TetR/AcrR family transcriptional regulator n=1 Tax=Pseudonocardia sp. TRM90224 TaxID=2812678 RepID=UPI001E5127F5|nr:TetR/AcrR family transcriptional regulator [Pseudonocardia sp. TRM90224]
MSRREQVLDTAVEVLGGGGMRRLTHGAIDAAAGVPAGTTSNVFRTRDALVSGLVAHIEALDRAEWAGLAGTDPPADADALAEALVGFVRHAVGPARARTAARYALFLESLARPELRAALLRSRAQLVEWAAWQLRELGSPAPHEHCRMLLDHLDGVILHELVLQAGGDVETGIRALLRGLLG